MRYPNTVQWKIDNNVVYSTTYHYGEEPVYNGDEPTKNSTAMYSYVFEEWLEEEGDRSVTFNAVFSEIINKYTVAWVNWDGEVLGTEDVEYGTKPVFTGDTPTRDADSENIYTFAGWTPELAEMDENGATYTATYTSESRTVVTIIQKTVNFTGKMALNMKFMAPDSLKDDEGAKVIVTSSEGDTEEVLLSSLSTETIEGIGEVFVLSRPVYAPEMSKTYTLQFVDGNGDLVDLENYYHTEFPNGYSASGYGYLDQAIAGVGSSFDDFRPLAQAAKDYGIAAQIYFNYGDSTGLSVSQAVKDLDPEEDLKNYEKVNEGELPDLIENVFMTVGFNTDSTLSVGFTFKEAPTDEQLKSLTCTVDGKTASLIKKSDTVYVLKVRNIPGAKLDIAHVFTITDGSKTFTTTRSALSYAYTLATYPNNEMANDLGKALYLYNQAAKTYFHEDQ